MGCGLSRPMIVTFHKNGESIDLKIDDARCDALLDHLSANFQTPNAETDRRWELMMTKREAAARGDLPKRKGRR